MAATRFEVRRAAVEVVEAARHLARQLHVRGLVLAHRHEGGLVDQDVGRLQQRVAQEAVGRQVAVAELFDLVLVGGHALQPAQRRAHGQQREQLGMLGQSALQEDGAAVRIQPGCQPVGHHLIDVLAHDLAAFVVRGQRMPVGDEVEAVVVVLQPHPVLESAVVVAQVHGAGGAHAGENAGLHRVNWAGSAGRAAARGASIL
jgi:hypothetical protein